LKKENLQKKGHSRKKGSFAKVFSRKTSKEIICES